MRQWQDKPILGVLNLETGETSYEQGEAVFTFLSPWLSTLAARVVEKRQPLYRLDPAEWELHVVSQFGRDKQLPNAAFPGLSLAQRKHPQLPFAAWSAAVEQLHRPENGH